MADGIPPWVTRERDPVAAYARGVQLGQSAAELEQRAVESARRMQALQIEQQQRAAAQAREAALQAQAQQQRTATAQAEIAAEVSKQRELAEVAREELRIKREAQSVRDRQAAMRFAAAQGLQQRIAAGEDPVKALLAESQLWGGLPGATEKVIQSVIPQTAPFEFPKTATTIRDDQGNVVAFGIPTRRTGGSIVQAKQADVPVPPSVAINAIKTRIQLNNARLSQEPPADEAKRLTDENKALGDRLTDFMSTTQARTTPARSIATPTTPQVTSQKEASRTEALSLIKKYPDKADAIRQRFKEHYGEDL